MSRAKIVGRGVDTLVLNVSYADKQFQPVKQDELNSLQGEARINESPVVTNWDFKGFNFFMKEKESLGQWRWIPAYLLDMLPSHEVSSIPSLHMCASARVDYLHAKGIFLVCC